MPAPRDQGREEFSMRLAILSAVVLAAATASAVAQTATPANAPAAQPLRQLASRTIAPWQVEWVGNDEKVNHCIVARGTRSDKPTAEEPKLMFVVDHGVAILRLRAEPFRFTEKKSLKASLTLPNGTELNPLAATSGPDRADMKLEPKEMDALLAVSYVDARVDGMTVRLPFAGAAEITPVWRECMANIGKPAKGWTDGEIDQLVKSVKNGRAKCTTNKRTNTTMCDVE
jgi:hypothetical protein